MTITDMESLTTAAKRGHLGLNDLIARLERENPDTVLPLGFTRPHSFRGYYCDLAFEPAQNITVRDVLNAAKSALGTTYQGWKGGDFTMTGAADCWIAEEGDSSDNKIGPLLLELLLAAGRTPEAVTS